MVAWSGRQGFRTNKTDNSWIVSVVMSGEARCPACGIRSSRRHGWCVRHLQDLPAQGAAVKLALRLARCRCFNADCIRQTFGDRLPQIVASYGRRTCRVIDLARMLAHTAGGRPAGRLTTRLGIPQSKDTLLRSLKRGVNKQAAAGPARVVGVDDWSWRKGSTYGTIMVDLERRELWMSCKIAQQDQRPPGLLATWQYRS